MELTLKLITVGNSTGIAIPKDIMELLELNKGERVKIIIEKAKGV